MTVMHTLCRRVLLLFALLCLASAFYSAAVNAAVHEETTSRSFTAERTPVFSSKTSPGK